MREPSTPNADPPGALATPAGELPLAEYRLGLAGREWRVLHGETLLSFWDEQRFLSEQRDRVPYGVILWPAAIAMAHEIAVRGTEFAGRRVLELGAGTGLPGIVAATFGAHVVQTDRHDLALAVCRRNGERNGFGDGAAPPGGGTLTYRVGDWTAWDDVARYDYILGSDVLYGESTHPHLRRILAANLAPGGRVLLSDPFRPYSLRVLQALETEDGWTVGMSRWSVGEDTADAEPRPIGVFELTRGAAAG